MDVAKQRDEDKELAFMEQFDLLLYNHPERLIMIDKTHKDQNAARKRRGWKKNQQQRLLNDTGIVSDTQCWQQLT